MPRDYKDITKQAKKADKSVSPLIGNLLSFAAGLSLGLFVAAYFYLESALDRLLYEPEADEVTAVQGEGEAAADTDDRATVPKFEFYTILKNRKLNISERIADEQENKAAQADESSVYVLQVGSFKEYQAADQLRAQLALIGITAYITRVVINGDDSRNRVRVGPFENQEKLDQARTRLDENNLPYVLLKLELEDPQGTG